ncbi:MAG: DUF502 domain-containing protein [Betaproteobacteria bacterium]|jgi:uncharacterized membrane protein|nr:DUF502 domain-containing protein [Betaproteobacteria bacterium]
MHANIHLARLAAGFIALLPLALTLGLVAWLATFIARFLGPGSTVGNLLANLGFQFVAQPAAAYALGLLILIAAIYVLGMIVRTRLKGRIMSLVTAIVGPIPVVGRLYDVASKFVALLDRKDKDVATLDTMTTVWCFFGGEGGAAALALMPSPETVTLDGKPYRAVLIPTAPVPFGGGLLYVPEEWVKPAGIGVERLTSTYISMGISSPPGLGDVAKA